MTKSKVHSKSSGHAGRKGQERDLKYRSDDARIYLDKRTMVRSAQRAGRHAAIKAMDAMGFSIVAQNGWIIRKHKDGLIEKIQ